MEFKHFGKIPRFRTFRARITEKLDGTNAQVLVPEDPGEPLRAGSRNRWLTPRADNFGFAHFVEEHSDALRALGVGRHYGEWWGMGIQRGYGLEERRFWLFNGDRFPDGLPTSVTSELGPRIGLVPTLSLGPLDLGILEGVTAKLFANGSVAVPGWSKPEGVVIEIGGQRWKITDNGDTHKGANDNLVHE